MRSTTMVPVGRVRGVLLALVSLCGLMVASISPAAYAEGPSVTVTPSGELQVGERVRVEGVGLVPRTSYQVIVCDYVAPDADFDRCDTIKNVRSSAGGALRSHLRVPGVVQNHLDIGDYPVYCRDDACRVFLATVNEFGELDSVSSDPLQVTGSTASIEVSPAGGLRDKQNVRVSGTADGAEGRAVRLQQQVCSSRLLDFSCSSDLPARTARIGSDGSYSRHIRVRRYVDGYDCAQDGGGFSFCVVSAQVLRPAGGVDDSYGFAYSALGFDE